VERLKTYDGEKFNYKMYNIELKLWMKMIKTLLLK
jgi:hypothetical protein